MSEQEAKVRKQTISTPWYKKAALPWLIIGFIVTALTFTVFGWNMRETMNTKVAAEASHLASLGSK